MKQKLASLLQTALTASFKELDASFFDTIKIDRTKDAQHGDYSSNAALVLAKTLKKPPMVLAQEIVSHLPSDPSIARAVIAPPGFINFFVNVSRHDVVAQILTQGDSYFLQDLGQQQRVLIEYVSANPTGPLHVGHGRGAAFGATLANILRATGFLVDEEYYVNDAGRQMDILAVSVWLRYLELYSRVLPFPQNGYRGDYIRDVAKSLQARYQDAFMLALNTPPENTDPEIELDEYIAFAKQALNGAYNLVFDHAGQEILNGIKQELYDFRVHHNDWFSEKTLTQGDAIAEALDKIKEHTYQSEGALWFAASKFGDEKDRVLQRQNGQYTYFASDIAYHFNKLARGYDLLINILGADHHGYAPRVHAALMACGYPKEKLLVLLVQFATLIRGGEHVSMSTRAGMFVTLRELYEEVGVDAARFFYVQRRTEQHMEFDLDLAKSESQDNPVYYVQYAHARIKSVERKLAELNRKFDQAQALQHLTLLNSSHELVLLESLSQYKEVVQTAARTYEPHRVVHYLRELAAHFHAWYNAVRLISENESETQARLGLAFATRLTLAHGLGLLGVTAKEVM